MSILRTNRRSLGINFSSRGESEVMVWAPKAKEVAVIFAENNDRVVLNEEERGYFSCITPKLKPGDRYYFELDQNKRYPDPASLLQPEGVGGPSEVFNLHHFQWSDGRWKNHSLKDYIFYELHVGTFTPGGSFCDIEEKLEYLQKLGVTAIEIMPVAEFSGKRNWGYDGVLPFAVHHAYGGPAALQHLVNACHQHGIAVVLDVVYNHMGPEGNNFDKFGHYFTNKYQTPWGSAINFDDAGSDEVRLYFIENVLMWFRDFHIDALRLDAVHAIRDLGPVHILQEIRNQADALMEETGRTHYLIAECDLNDPKFIKPVDVGGYGMDAQWVDEFHHSLRVTAGNEPIGYFADFKGLLHLAKSFRDGYVYDGIYSEHRQKTFGVKAAGLAGEKFIVFSQNHDQIGNRMLGERTSALVSFEMQKLMAAVVLTSPYLPFIFMGEEYGETNPFQYFVSHSDEHLIEAVRAGRKKEFESFHHGEDVPDPQSEQTFMRSKLQWNLLRDIGHITMLKYYTELIALRKNLKSLSNGSRDNVDVAVYHDEQMMSVRRWHEPEQVVCIFNFSNKMQHLDMAAVKNFDLKLDSSSKKWLGTTQHLTRDNSELAISPESFMLFVRNV